MRNSGMDGPRHIQTDQIHADYSPRPPLTDIRKAFALEDAAQTGRRVIQRC
jgi:hypothetical protein